MKKKYHILELNLNKKKNICSTTNDNTVQLLYEKLNKSENHIEKLTEPINQPIDESKINYFEADIAIIDTVFMLEAETITDKQK
ncbi:hypothetical protein PIROE2DRAFT_18087 [Piromyces sp. E2]|nr:hypothetical protein PIROE2DRAFT_18087 [Piromyces sp. E2]|eukprot:OUM57047.1 hypothetical protein PIROE2DRAFT_18087 [Piromyces sp. E2]